MCKENIAIKNPDVTCCKCLKETTIHNINIGAMGYGSGFDSWSTQINLCDECYKFTNPEWWKLNEKIAFSDGDYDFTCYEFEDEIFEFAGNLPLAGQELFWNHYSTEGYTMYAQDWIDYQLGILSHEKCKEYGRYSPQEIQAYKDRFPKCKHVELKIYGDGSSHTQCFRNAFGESDGTCHEHNISNECYMCDRFKEKIEDIKTIYVEEEELKREKQRLKEMIAYAKEKLNKIESE
jgi:hypothetical protein